MEDFILIAGWFSGLWSVFRIVVSVAVGVTVGLAIGAVLVVASATTAVIVSGAILAGAIAGTACYCLFPGFLSPPLPPPPPPPAPVVVSLVFLQDSNRNGAKAYCCTIISNTKIIGKREIKANSGIEFHKKLNDELYSIRYVARKESKRLYIESVVIYEKPFPGDSPLENIDIASKKIFPNVKIRFRNASFTEDIGK